MDVAIDDRLRIPALDGFGLAATLYEPEPGAGRKDSAVLINSATAVRRRYYDAYARFLAGQGFTVVTYEGRSFSGVPTTRWHRSMPGVCQRFNVACCTLPEALKMLGAEF